MNSLSVLKVPVNHRNVLRNVFLKSRSLDKEATLPDTAQICRTKIPRLQFLLIQRQIYPLLHQILSWRREERILQQSLRGLRIHQSVTMTMSSTSPLNWSALKTKLMTTMLRRLCILRQTVRKKVAKKSPSSTSTSTVSPLVPSKVKKCSVERSNDEEKDSNPDSQFLEDVKKYTVPGK